MTTTTNLSGSSLDRFFASIRRSSVVRSDQRFIGGVASGIAQHIGIDPNVFRIILVVLMFIGVGSIIPFYLAAWALLPDARTGRIAAQEWLARPSITA